MSMTNTDIIKAIGLMAKIEPSKHSFDGHCTSVMYKDPEKCLGIIEEWWAKNKPITNAEYVKRKLEESGYNVTFDKLVKLCPPHKDSYFGEVSRLCEMKNCKDCLNWWDEYRVGD